MKMVDTTEITALLERWRNGDKDVLFSIWQRVYPELKREAVHAFRRCGANRTYNTLSYSALVQTAFAKLLGKNLPNLDEWNSRKEFFRYMQTMMTNMLIDRYRKKQIPMKRVDNIDERASSEYECPWEERTYTENDFILMNKAFLMLKEVNPDLYSYAEAIFLVHPSRTIRDLAEEMGVSERTISNRKASVQAQLRQFRKEIKDGIA